MSKSMQMDRGREKGYSCYVVLLVLVNKTYIYGVSRDLPAILDINWRWACSHALSPHPLFVIVPERSAQLFGDPTMKNSSR
jgi:hypothetical protein